MHRLQIVRFWPRTGAPASFRALLPDRRGVAAVTFVAMAAVLLGIAALATEVGGWYLARGSAQAAADAAAIAGAVALNSGGDPVAAGKAAADANHYNNAFAGSGLLSISVSIDNPPTLGAYAGDASATEANVSVTVAPSISGIFLGAGAVAINAHAVAKMLPINGACVLATDTSAVTGLMVSQAQYGNLCTYVANSPSSTAIDVTLGDPTQANVYAFSTPGDCVGCPPANSPLARPNASFQPPVADPYAATLGQLPVPNTRCLPADLDGAPVLIPNERNTILYMIPATGIPNLHLQNLATGGDYPTGLNWTAGQPYYAYCHDVTFAGISPKRVAFPAGVYYFNGAALHVPAGVTLECSWSEDNTTDCGTPYNGLPPTGVSLVFFGNATTMPTIQIDPAAYVMLPASQQTDGQPTQNFDPALLGVLMYRFGAMGPGGAGNPAVDIQGTPAPLSPPSRAGNPPPPPTFTQLTGLTYFPGATINYGVNGPPAGGVAQSTCNTLVAGTINLINQPSGFDSTMCNQYFPSSPQVVAGRIVE